jgi:hypothetical protein
MTDADWVLWLKNPNAIRLTLVKAWARVGGVETPFYWSNKGWTSGPNDNPANTNWLPLLRGSTAGVSMDLDPNGLPSARTSANDMELVGPPALLTTLLGYVWSNRAVEVYFGDPRWPLSDFRRISTQISAKMVRKDAKTLGLMMGDKMRALNAPVTELKLGGSGQYKDSIIPLCFGEVSCCIPLLIDANALVYQVHQGAIKEIKEVRDMGVPLVAGTDYTVDLANGKFTLLRQPAGAINCTVAGDNFNGVYANTVASIIRRIITGFGKASTRLSNADIETDTSKVGNFTSFDSSHQQLAGIYISDRTNVIEVVNRLSQSLGSQVFPSANGLLRIVQIGSSGAGSAFTLTTDHLVDNQAQAGVTMDPVAAVKLAFCRNYNPTTSVSARLPAHVQALYADEWMTDTQVDQTTADTYKLTTDPDATETCLQIRSEVSTECLRQLGFKKFARRPYTWVCRPEALQIEVGQALVVSHPKLELTSTPATCIGVTPDPSTGNVTVRFVA